MTTVFHTFEEAENYCNSFITTGTTQKERTLRRIEHLMELLGNPQKNIHAIHITGSYGKSSTAYMIASLLEQKGLSVGLHMKPHLESITERMCINRIPISKEAFITYVNRIRPIVALMDEQPTYFELLVALMLLYFSDRHVDVAVIEVGRGGRLDATHICPSDIVALTNVFLVHTDILGASKEKILQEKLGLAHTYTNIVVGSVSKHLRSVLQSFAKKINARVTYVDAKSIDTLSIPLKGKAQKENAALAIQVAAAFTHLTTEEIAAALTTMKLPGRFEVHSEKTNTIIMDGAHNKEKMNFLYKDFITYYPDNRITLILKYKQDNDIPTYIRIFKPIINTIILVLLTPNEQTEKKQINSALYLSINETISYIRCQTHTTFLITGSMKLIGKIRAGLSIPYQLK